MSFGIANFEDGVRTRLVADNPGLTDLIQDGGVWIEFAALSEKLDLGALPIVVISNWVLTHDDTFPTNTANVQGEIHVFDYPGNGLTPSRDVLARIYGDSGNPASAPTFGLHRFQLVPSSGSESTVIVRRTERSEHGVDAIHYIQEYETWGTEV